MNPFFHGGFLTPWRSPLLSLSISNPNTGRKSISMEYKYQIMWSKEKLLTKKIETSYGKRLWSCKWPTTGLLLSTMKGILVTLLHIIKSLVTLSLTWNCLRTLEKFKVCCWWAFSREPIINNLQHSSIEVLSKNPTIGFCFKRPQNNGCRYV